MKNPIPQGKYVPAKRAGNLIFTAGMTPRIDGKLIITGKVDGQKPLEYYRQAVRQATENALAAAVNTAGDMKEIESAVSMTVYINSGIGFTAHSALADFASEYLVEQLGENGVVCRTAVGVWSLPGDAPVEVALVLMASK